MPGLTPKQALFVAEYLKDLNGTAAAKRAGYSEKTSEKMAYQNLHLVPAVVQAVEEALKRRSERVEVKADDILRELMRMASTDIGRAFREDGSLLPLKEMPEDVRRAIASIDITDSGTRIRFWDKLKANELLAKHLGLLTEKLQVSGGVSIIVHDPYAKPEAEGG